VIGNRGDTGLDRIPLGGVSERVVQHAHCSVLVEHPELVSERIQRFAGAVGRENVIAGADCGFASMPRAVAEVHPTIVWAKFKSLSEGARLASRALWT